MKDALLSTLPIQEETGVASGGGWFKRLLHESAEEWKFPPGLVAMIWWAPFVILLLGLVAALIGGNVYRVLTGEDRLAENLQVYCWLLAFGMGWLVIQHLGKAGRYGMAFLYFCLNAGIFLIIGEELSWGQRLFGWETPEALKAVNRQRETNIHSLEGMVDTFRSLYLVIGAYGTILPVLFFRARKSTKYQNVISLLAPHFTLSPYFLVTLIWRIYLNFWKLPEKYYFEISKYSEVVELILALGFFLFISFQFRKIKPHG
jgi:hypothetical protein